MKTYSVKPDDIKRETHVIDATGKILGRLATEIATILMGKNKAMFSRIMDVGDFVTVINAEKIEVTGKKPSQKLYYWHSNYPGGFKNISYTRLMHEHPERIVAYAVDGMLPHNHQHDKMLNRLHVYAGPIATKEASSQVKVDTKVKRPKAQIVNVRAEVKVAAKKEAKR